MASIGYLGIDKTTTNNTTSIDIKISESVEYILVYSIVSSFIKKSLLIDQLEHRHLVKLVRFENFRFPLNVKATL